MLSLALAGCANSGLKDATTAQPITNELGHVVGRKEVLNQGGPEELVRIVRYTPRLGTDGQIVAYEEAVPEGTILRSLDGRRFGVVYRDLRSQGTNPNNQGLTVNFSR